MKAILDNFPARTVERNSPRPLFECVEHGIYRYVPNGTYYERPAIHGKRTWRSLKTKNLKAARKKLQRLRAGIARTPGIRTALPARLDLERSTVGEVICRYRNDGYLDKRLNSRSDANRETEERHCVILLKFWNNVATETVTDASCDA